MSVALAIVIMVVVLNPPRRAAELRAGPATVAAGAAICLAVLVVLGAGGESLLDSLDISAPTYRVAVGLVLVVRGAIDLVRGPAPVDMPEGAAAGAIAPVFFPILFRPDLGLVGVSVAVDAGLGAMTVGAVAGLMLVVVLHAAGTGPSRARALGVFFSTVMIVLAVDRLIDGVFAL